MRHCSWWTIHAALLCSLACGDDANSPPATAKDAGGSEDSGKLDAGGEPVYRSAVYALDENWLCNPNAANNRCKDGNPDATEVMTDNKLSAVATPQHVDTKLDCFYVYPTVDLTQTAGRVSDYSNIETIWSTAKQQATPFSDVCTVYAPLYHQAKIGSYLDPTRDALLEEAYAEIEDAFKHYMAQYNHGRDIVLIGHSQGTHMLRRLIQRHFEGDENKSRRDQLALALLIGTLGDITVPPGKLVGGTFKDVPLCASKTERGCVITYSTYSTAKPPTAAFGLFVGGVPMGMDTACSNPAALGGGKAASSGAYFPSVQAGTTGGSVADLKTQLGVSTYFAVYKGMYSFECKQNETGLSYLAVTVDQAANDQRKDPIQYGAPGLAIDLVGLHQLDFNLALADLQAMLAQHVK
jgi:hypothetical protein